MVKNASAIATLVAVLVVIILPVAQEIKLILFLVIFFVFIYVKRGYIYVAIASRTLNKKDADEAKAWRMFKRGWEAGLAPNYNLMLANLWIQRSDIETAGQMLDSIIERESRKKKPNVQVIAGAKISKSMAHWAMNERDKAIEILQTLRAEKTVDKNLYINLSSFCSNAVMLKKRGGYRGICIGITRISGDARQSRLVVVADRKIRRGAKTLSFTHR